MTTSQLLISHIGELVTNDPAHGGLLGTIEDAAVVASKGVITWVGKTEDLPADTDAIQSIDAGGASVIPGYVDAHTHVVFAGDRADEFALRMAGASYEEIQESGGGIYSTVEATRAATLGDLVSASVPRIDHMLVSGTTTAEVKSGYGLDIETEAKMLEAIVAIDDITPIDLIPTFLGAHVVGPEYRERRGEYVDLVKGPMLDRVAPLAQFIDVFCDDAAFTLDETRAVVAAGQAHGLGVRLHVDQLSHSGGTALAAELGVLTADHVDHATDEDLAALANAGTVAVLLPGVSYAMRMPPPPARRVWDAGVPVAIATDCNPGSSYVETMSLIISLAVVTAGLTTQEAVWAATKGGALALGLTDRGVIAPGMLADMVILDAPSHVHLAYRPAGALPLEVIKRGILV